MRSASAFFRPSRSPFGSKAVLGSDPANNWSRMASGMRGSLRLGMVVLLPPHHSRPNTKFRIVPFPPASPPQRSEPSPLSGQRRIVHHPCLPWQWVTHERRDSIHANAPTPTATVAAIYEQVTVA